MNKQLATMQAKLAKVQLAVDEAKRVAKIDRFKSDSEKQVVTLARNEKIQTARNELKIGVTEGLLRFKKQFRHLATNELIFDQNKGKKGAGVRPLTNYELETVSMLSPGNITNIENGSGLTTKTLISLGVGVGYEASPIQVLIAVLSDFEGIEHELEVCPLSGPYQGGK